MFTISHDYYGILGVSKEATEEEIKSQYKKLMKEHHPDQYKGLRAKYVELGDEDLLKVFDEKIRQAEEMSKLINEAFEALIDPIKRRQYDDQIYEPAVAKPEIAIHPTKLTFGTLTEGQRKVLFFTVENKGGPVGSVNVDWEGTKPDWGELVIEPDPEATFPIKVTVKVDTTGIPSGTKYEKVQVTVDGEVHLVEVYMAVEVTTKVVITATAPSATPSGPAPTPISVGRVKSKVWRVFVPLAILAAVLFCVLPTIVEKGQQAKEKQEILEDFPVEITQAERFRCRERYSDDRFESLYTADTFCITVSVRNRWVAPSRLGPVEGKGIRGNILVAAGVDGSIPCFPALSPDVEPNEVYEYLCVEEEKAMVETVCLDVGLLDPIRVQSPFSEGYFLSKTICSNVVTSE